MRFDTKIAIVVRSDLAVWQKLNVTAFLASGIAAGIDEVAGKPYEDGSGNRYLEMFRQPVLVYAGSGEELGAVRERAISRGMAAAVYTEEMFSTGDDDTNRAVVRYFLAAHQPGVARDPLSDQLHYYVLSRTDHLSAHTSWGNNLTLRGARR